LTYAAPALGSMLARSTRDAAAALAKAQAQATRMST
jgi:hypothetical protein